MPTEALIAWLGDSDPALRWQVERDLAGEPPAGEPSKWLTLYGTRVLAWWDSRARA